MPVSLTFDASPWCRILSSRSSLLDQFESYRFEFGSSVADPLRTSPRR